MKLRLSWPPLVALSMVVALHTLLSTVSPVRSLSCEDTCDGKSGGDRLSCLQEVQNACESALQETKAQKKTLQSTISYLNSKISLTQSQIYGTQTEIEILQETIEELSGKIDVLNVSLEKLSQVLVNRVHETYKRGQTEPVYVLLTADGMSDFMKRYKYLKVSQQHDREVMFALEEARSNYDQQKSVKEVKQEEMEALQSKLISQQAALANQQDEKQALLAVTKNNESKYQDLLSQAKKEIEALASSEFTGKRDVKRGEVIGRMGSTGFSTGAHLHFGYYNISQDEADSIFTSSVDWYYSRHMSPTNALASKTLRFEARSCNDVPDALEKAIGSGSFPWPMSDPRITQCYGSTPFSSVYPGNTHKGLDMSDRNDILVRAVEEGTAYFYRGKSSFGNNVRIFHPNGTMTLYLHLQ